MEEIIQITTPVKPIEPETKDPKKRICNIPNEPVVNKSSNFLMKILPIVFVLVVTIGLIIYLSVYYIPDLKEDIYNEVYNSSFDAGYSNGTFDEMNNSEFYYNYGYLVGQEEVMIQINTDAEIPIISYNSNDEPIVEWYSINQVCGALQ